MKISIVTVCLNAAATISDTLESVVAQDWPDLEHIVIDGGSTDGTLDIVALHRHPRLRLVSGRDKGMYDAMNRGLAEATGDVVGFLNADDFFSRADALRQLAERFRETGADSVLAGVQFVDQHGRRGRGRYYATRRFRPWWLRIGVMPPHPGFYVRTAIAREAGFDLGFRIAADFDFVARLILVQKIRWTALAVPLVCFREGGLTTRDARVKFRIGREIARSLHCIGQPCANLSACLRYPFKLLQFAPRRRDGFGAAHFWR